MKAATGELNLTVITITAIAAIMGFFWFMWNGPIKNAINSQWENVAGGDGTNPGIIIRNIER